MNKIFKRIPIASILTGALLFLSISLFASISAENDSIYRPRYKQFQTHMKALQHVDSIKALSDTLIRTLDDSLQTSLADTALIDSLQTSLRDTTLIDSLVRKHAYNPFFKYRMDTSSVDEELQDTLLSETDTTNVFKKKKLYKPSPQRATILSAVFPGLGQAYNHRYWKMPIIYAGGAALFYGYYTKNEEFIEAKRVYNLYQSTGEIPEDETAQSLESNRDAARQDRDYFVIYMGLLYVANVVDAMTDAYFRQYDISDNLSLTIKPDISPSPSFAHLDVNYGLKIKLKF